MSEMYFSVDVETNGPVPGLHSMLSIGVSALHPVTLEEVDHFYRTLLVLLRDADENPDTMKWWAGFPEQYAAATRDPSPPWEVMTDLDAWVRSLVEDRFAIRDASGAAPSLRPRVPIFVAYPVAFDFGFYNYYAHRFVGRSAFGFVGLDMASLAMGFNGGAYDDQIKKKWPDEWVKPADRVAIHHALDDARQQADIFRRMMRTIRRETR